MTCMQRAELYCAYLQEEGYGAKMAESGNIRFKYEGLKLYIPISEDDDEYFLLLCPNFFKIEEDKVSWALLSAAEITINAKVVKVFLNPDDSTNVSASFEMFCSSPEDVFPVFRRAFDAIKHATERFVEIFNR